MLDSKLITAFFVAIIVVVSGNAQDRTFIIEGTVFDQTGAVIVGAQISIDDGRNHHVTTETDNNGSYRLVVPSGAYTLTTSAKGFARYTQVVKLTTNVNVTIDVTLRISLRENLEINAARETLNVLTLTNTQIAMLPHDPRLVRRHLERLARATGGSGGAAIYVDGSREEGRLPPKEMIGAIRVRSDSLAAEFSEPGEARVDITTLSTAATVHGDLNFTFNEPWLNARDPFALSRAPLRLRDYGIDFSGPIERSRWGYFVELSRSNARDSSVINATILNSLTLQPEHFAATVNNPARNTDLSFRTNYFLGNKHQLDFRYAYSNSRQFNVGLEDGFDLPERGANSTARDDTIKFAVTSVFSARLLNEARLDLARSRNRDIALNSQPAVIVLDSFNGGGNQDLHFNDELARLAQFSDNITYAFKRHTVKSGILIDATRIRNTDQANFGGTFIFGTDFERNSRGLPLPGPILISPLESYRRVLLGLPGFRPLQFTIAAGDPSVRLTQWQASAFMQDEWRKSSRLTLSFGLRSEFQTHLSRGWSFAPRTGLAIRPFKGNNATLRIGAGLFYSRIDPAITIDTQRFDGTRVEQLIVQRPAFFSTIPSPIPRATSLSLLRTKSPDLRAPRSFVSSVIYEQPLSKTVSVVASYTWQRGSHLQWTRNVNAPLPGTSVRPQPGLGPILEYESAGRSTFRQLVVAFKGELKKKVSFYGTYQLAFARSNTDSPSSTPANSYDASTEFGRAASDQRHQLYFETDVTLPWGFSLSSDISIGSNIPFNITTGNDDNGDTLFVDRPAFANAGDAGAVITSFGVFNPHPQSGDKIIPRNFGRGPTELITDLSISRVFTFGRSQSDDSDHKETHVDNRPRGNGALARFARSVGERSKLTLGVDISNLLNHTNFDNFNGVLTSPVFGRANAADSSRRIKIAMRLDF